MEIGNPIVKVIFGLFFTLIVFFVTFEIHNHFASKRKAKDDEKRKEEQQKRDRAIDRKLNEEMEELFGSMK